MSDNGNLSINKTANTNTKTILCAQLNKGKKTKDKKKGLKTEPLNLICVIN